MTTIYRPAVAFPAELVQEGMHYASGVNREDEVYGLVGSARRYGITVTEVTEKLLVACEDVAGGLVEIFVDSGAFSEVEFSPAAGRLVVVESRRIDAAGWRVRFDVYARIARAYGPRARVVAPDCVGDQDETLARLTRHAADVAAIAALRAHIIVPVQKGSLPMSAMFARAVQILGLRETPIAGVPMKKDATSIADLRELVASLPWYGARLHLLGIGPESKKFAAAVQAIRAIRPNAEITSDSVLVRRLVGRTNGRGNGPRVLTRYQDDARAAGLPSPKSHALMQQGLDERDRELDRAHAAGWFDEELYDSAEEAAAHVAELRAERAAYRSHVQLVMGFARSA